jgi:hypothetical protein
VRRVVMVTGFEDRNNSRIARVFFDACTRSSADTEDILPQEGGADEDYSVFHVFSLLFPDIVGSRGAGGIFFALRSRVHVPSHP